MGLHLAGLNAIAAYLELVVAPAEVDQPAGHQAHPIAGTIDGQLLFADPQGAKAPLHPPHVAVGQLRAEQHQLPLAGGLLPRPQNERLHAGQRQTDGQLGLAGVFQLQLLGGHHHCGLGGAVGVEEAHIGAALALPLGQLLGVDRLAADDDGGQIGRDMGLTRR